MGKIDAFWKDRWVNKDTPWDMGGPHPKLVELFEEGFDPENKGQAYIPGCGRAHDGALLAKQGWQVIAEDLIAEAIEEAKLAYGHNPQISFRVGNVFEVPADDRERFDLVFDRAMMCALKPELWSPYIEAICSRLKPGGLFISIPFQQVDLDEEQGPPFAITDKHWDTIVLPHFETVIRKSHKPTNPQSKIQKEMLFVGRLKY